MWSQQVSSSCKSNMSVSTCLKSLPKRKSTNSLLSAVDGRVVITLVFVEVEVTDSSTIGDVSFYIILHADTVTSGEGSHLSLTSFVPDDTLDVTLTSANGIEVDLGGGGVESHRCLSITL